MVIWNLLVIQIFSIYIYKYIQNLQRKLYFSPLCIMTILNVISQCEVMFYGDIRTFANFYSSLVAELSGFKFWYLCKEDQVPAKCEIVGRGKKWILQCPTICWFSYILYVLLWSHIFNDTLKTTYWKTESYISKSAALPWFY